MIVLLTCPVFHSLRALWTELQAPAMYAICFYNIHVSLITLTLCFICFQWWPVKSHLSGVVHKRSIANVQHCASNCASSHWTYDAWWRHYSRQYPRGTEHPSHKSQGRCLARSWRKKLDNELLALAWCGIEHFAFLSFARSSAIHLCVCPSTFYIHL